MPLSQEHVGSKIVAKIKIYKLTRAELLLNLCYEIPCILKVPQILKKKHRLEVNINSCFFEIFESKIQSSNIHTVVGTSEHN